ncbi:MAG: T9SS type A sorting domain-containing protein [Ignavibacteriales bacterium]|nr:T9SS type A sorting domain-containing protein [Ignavibacteriales bacterium]
MRILNPVTTIQYEVAESRIRLKLYDITGREITTLVDEGNPGEYRVSFDASGLPSGVYIYRIEADKFQ